MYFCSFNIYSIFDRYKDYIMAIVFVYTSTDLVFGAPVWNGVLRLNDF